MLSIDEIKELKVAKYQCLTSFLFFTRYFFRHRYRRKFVIGEHHQIISEALQRVVKGECKRLIINIAPRYGKTELAVKNFIAYGLALNPAAKFIHLTYADALALDNSEEAKDLVKSPEYQQMFPHVQIKRDSDSKNKWYTTAGGGVYAAAAGGQVTGFGAGKVDDDETEALFDWLDGDFAGAIIIDDPIKPDDAQSGIKRERINTRFETTIRNRVNSRNTPIIVIGQRVHEHDLSGYLIETEPGEWEVLSLPVLREDKTSLWPFKHTVEELERLKGINEYVFETQYQQNPKPLSGLIYGNWKQIDESLLPQTDQFIGGIDYGYTNDPTAAVKVWIQGGSIFIHELCYEPGLPAIQIAEMFKAHGYTGRTPIYSEHDTEMIAQLRRLGLSLTLPANKKPGSLNNGILKVQEYNVFYTKSSHNIAKEIMNYAWMQDPETGKASNTPIDRYNHLMDAVRYAVYTHCFK